MGIYVIKDGKKFWDKETRKKIKKQFFQMDRKKILSGYLNLTDDEILIHPIIGVHYNLVGKKDKGTLLKVSTIADFAKLKFDRAHEAIKLLVQNKVIWINEYKKQQSPVSKKKKDKSLYIGEVLMKKVKPENEVRFLKPVAIGEVWPDLSKTARKLYLVFKAARDDEWMEKEVWINREYDLSYPIKKEVRDVLEISRPTYNRAVSELLKTGVIQRLEKSSKSAHSDGFRVF